MAKYPLCEVEAQKLKEKIRHLNKDTGETRQIIAGLYAILTTLDAKASGLLRVNSIFIAVLTFFLGWLINKNPPPKVHWLWHVVTYVDLTFFAISSFLCLCIVRVSWSFYGKAELDNGTYKFDKELNPLARTTTRRTWFYQAAWYFTFIALVGFAAIAVGVLSQV
jgi:hypothetical protein